MPPKSAGGSKLVHSARNARRRITVAALSRASAWLPSPESRTSAAAANWMYATADPAKSDIRPHTNAPNRDSMV